MWPNARRAGRFAVPTAHFTIPMNEPIPAAARLNGDPSLTFPFAQAPTGGTWQEVAPGVLWLRMPLPFALDHINL
jgi:hypothetical protein